MIVVIVCLLAGFCGAAEVFLAEREIDRQDGELWTTRQALDSAVADLRLIDEHRAAHAERLDRTFGGQP